MKTIRIVLVAAAVALLSSCCGCRNGKSKTVESLAGTSWQLIQMDGRSIVSTDGNFSVEFSPADGKISGKGDCNRVSGMYKTDSTGKLTVTGLVSTRAFCNNQADEDAFVKHLSNADTYAIDHKTLILFADGQIVMMFSRK